MCGIAGVISWSTKHRVSREMLGQMSAKIAHRGPDGEGLHLNHDGEATSHHPQVGLVHRRLAILDPDPRSNQPFTDGRGRWLVFNGEIYNFRELRKELAALLPDYEWRTTGDTEVLLASYAAWGEKCVDHLNGMFAFAVWDENANSLYLARDRMGQKPLYVLVPTGFTDAFGPRPVNPPVLAFASEIAALRAVPWFDAAINFDSLSDYLRWGHTSARTIYENIFRIAPGEWITIFGNQPQHGDLYFVPDETQDNGPKNRARTRDLLMQAVSRQLVSDVPLGCFLSGGMDSSIIAACMKQCRKGGDAVHTFSIGFDDRRYDETAYAAQVAAHLGTQHHSFVVKPNAADDLPRLASVFGEPFADSSALPTHYLARETRQHVKVALSGDGGDELFGGYDRYQAVRYAGMIDWIPRRVLRGVAQPISTALQSGHPKSWRKRISRLLATIDRSSADRYTGYVELMSPDLVRELYARPLPTDRVAKYFNAMLKAYPAVTAARRTDLLFYLPDDLLTKVDRASMLHALEVRSPFMDHELVQFAAGLTTDQLLKGGPKRMLREAFADDLPAWVFSRKKMGFAVPIGEWFRGELRAMLHDHLFATDSFARQHFNMTVVQRLVDEHEQFRVDHSQRLYALLMLELWWRATLQNADTI